MNAQNESNVRNNIASAICQCKRGGTTGMSVANLFQITPTTGLTCYPAIYRQEFSELARQVAKSMQFRFYGELAEDYSVR